jgi:hypothetical protein
MPLKIGNKTVPQPILNEDLKTVSQSREAAIGVEIYIIRIICPSKRRFNNSTAD